MLTDFQFFSLLNWAIYLQQSIYYTAHHTFNVLLHYLAKSKLLILLFCMHNKCKCSYFWTRKRGCFYPPHTRRPWDQNKWSELLGCAAVTGDAARYPWNFWRLHFSAGYKAHIVLNTVNCSDYWLNAVCLLASLDCSWMYRVPELPYILAYKSQNLRQNLDLKVGGATYTRVIK